MPSLPLVHPSPRQQRWHELECFSIVHFGLNTFTDKEWGYGDESPRLFDPPSVDANQWARVAREAGLKGIILVGKHHDGFCLWPTATTEHSVRHSPWREGRGDLVAEVSQACRDHGLAFGIYLSPWDRNHPEYGKAGYVEVYHRQLRELLTGYGPLFEIWFDGANGGDGYYGGANEVRSIDATTYYQWDVVRAICRELQPDACLFNAGDIRYVGNEAGIADETCWATFRSELFDRDLDASLGAGLRDGDQWMPAECDFPLRKGWFFHPEDFVRQPHELFEIYFKSVGRGAAMNIGLAPDRHGLIHGDDEAALRGWSELLRATFEKDLLRDFRRRESADGRELIFEGTQDVSFNVLSIEEDILLGQRVEAFVVETWDEGSWSEWAAATSIGSKRLLLGKSAATSKLRIRFLEAAGQPAMARIGLFRTPNDILLTGKLTASRDGAGLVTLSASNSGLSIRYTIDGTEPDATSPLYQRPFPFPSGGTVKAFAFVDAAGAPRGASLTCTFGSLRTDWKIVSTSLNSPFANNGTAGVEKLLDDDPSTYWHTYHQDKHLSAPPHEVVFDMGRAQKIRGFTCLPRAEGIEGMPDKYEFHLSPDGRNWSPAARGEFGNIKASPGMQTVLLSEPAEARFLRFVATRVVEGDYVAVAGIGVLPAP